MNTAIAEKSSRSPSQSKMVAWYDPLQLLRTGLDVAASTLFGRHADFRLIESLSSPALGIEDYTESGTRDDIWFDYVADTGDGWNSTYAIAYSLAQPHLLLKAPNGDAHRTERGAILIFGGDQVYPIASRAAYKERLVGPYATALPHTDRP